MPWEHPQVLWSKAVSTVDSAASSAGDASPRPVIHAEHGKSVAARQCPD